METKYESRVQAYEAEGLTTSDAQAVCDAEDLKASKPSVKNLEFGALFAKAQAAGLAAGVGVTPAPMVVQGGGKAWYVSEGMCGFAWVTVKPGNCPFANYLKKSGKGSAAYGGGVQIWISEHGQSADRKERHASAMARVLQEAGLKAYAGSRLD